MPSRLLAVVKARIGHYWLAIMFALLLGYYVTRHYGHTISWLHIGLSSYASRHCLAAVVTVIYMPRFHAISAAACEAAGTDTASLYVVGHYIAVIIFRLIHTIAAISAYSPSQEDAFPPEIGQHAMACCWLLFVGLLLHRCLIIKVINTLIHAIAVGHYCQSVVAWLSPSLPCHQPRHATVTVVNAACCLLPLAHRCRAASLSCRAIIWS